MCCALAPAKSTGEQHTHSACHVLSCSKQSGNSWCACYVTCCPMHVCFHTSGGHEVCRFSWHKYSSPLVFLWRPQHLMFLLWDMPRGDMIQQQQILILFHNLKSLRQNMFKCLLNLATSNSRPSSQGGTGCSILVVTGSHPHPDPGSNPWPRL